MTENIRIGEVADLLDVVPATVRVWVTKFGDDYLSDQANTRTGKRFSPGDVEMLREIQRLLRDGATYEEVSRQLQPRPQVVTGEAYEDAADQPHFDVPGVDRENAIQPLEFFENFINQLNTQHEREIASKDALINELKEDKSRLQEEVDRLRLPWWERLFRRPQG
jgi:DNA-binding transcriptional MerR regulator